MWIHWRSPVSLSSCQLSESCSKSDRYWDWTLDSSNLSASPIFSNSLGFGGDGSASPGSVMTVGHGRCIQDGPWANFTILYYHQEYSPHCLSRGFLEGKLLQKFWTERINPTAMAKLYDEDDYYSFLLKLEDGPHSAVPISIRGDFSVFTAPNGKRYRFHVLARGVC